ncbi:MAG: hypothetical protein AAF401_08205 [Pseudomonadota bacterium]
MKYFSGTWTNKVDAKGRVSIPAPFRKVLAAEASPLLFLRPEIKGKPAIDGFGESHFDEFAASLEQMNPHEDEYDALVDLMVSRTIQLPLDETGRIVLPAGMREGAGIESEALFVGRLRSFQIWRPGRYDALKDERQATGQASLGALPWGRPN